MNRTLIVAITTVVLLVAAAGIVFLTVGGGEGANVTANANVAAGANANVAPMRRIVTEEERGAITVGKSLAYRGVTFNVTSAGELDTFHQQVAPDGQKYVVLFVAPLSESDGDPGPWVSRDVRLVSATGTVASLTEVKIVGPSANTDSGYFWFTVGNSEHNFRLTFSSAGAEATLDLGF